MKLSIVIPCLVRDGLVERAVRSIGALPPSVELVIVEGERPLGHARNVGLSRAKGEYVAWIDGDDTVGPDWLPSILGALAAHPGVDLVVLGMRHVGWAGRGDTVWTAPAGPADPSRLLTDLYHDLGFAGNTVLFVARRGLWLTRPFDEDVVIGEDYLMAPRLVAAARSCVNLRAALYDYRCNPASLMTGADDVSRRDRIRILERRLAEAAPRDRRAALWGAGVECYWFADLAARGDVETPEADYGRRFIRRHLASFLAEALTGRRLPLRDRFGWAARFILAAVGCWTLQRWRAARQEAS